MFKHLAWPVVLGAGLLLASSGQAAATPLATVAPASVRVAVIMFTMPASPAFGISSDEVRDMYFGNGRSVATIYREASHGTLQVSGDVFGPYAISADESWCQPGDWSAAARAAAVAAGADLAGYDHFAYLFPRESVCPWAGLGDIGGTNSFINAPASGDVGLYHAAHELGHNLGADHAHSLSCASAGSAVSLADAAQCTTDEYGDPFSFMGTGIVRPPSAWERLQMGMLGSSDFQVVSSNDRGTYSLTPLEADSSGTKLLLVQRNSGGYLAIEYRQSSGTFPVFAGTAATQGVLVHVISADSARDSWLLDGTPATVSMRDGYFVSGSTLTDAADDLAVSFSSFSSGGAQVVLGNPGQSTSVVAEQTPPSPPPPPSGLTGSVATNGIVSLAWQAGAGADAPTAFQVLRAGRVVAAVSGTTYTTKAAITGTTGFGVRAIDQLGQTSPIVTFVATLSDSVAPSAVGRAWATINGRTRVTVHWTAASDDHAVARYQIRWAAGATLTRTGLFISFRHLKPGVHSLTITAVDVAGNLGQPTTVTFTL